MYHIIINPASRSGRGMKIWKEIEPVLLKKAVKFQAYFSKKSGDVAKETSRLSKLGDKINLIILGGDGTVNEAIQGMEPLENFTVGYIPTGSSNDLARDLGIPKNPLLALDLILNSGNVRAMDVGLLHYENITPSAIRGQTPGAARNRKFVVSAGIGFDAAVCAEALRSPIKDTCNRLGLGKLTYMGIALKQLIAAPKTSCDVWLDDKETPIHLDKFLFLSGMNHRYQGGGFKFCPDADYTDETFSICVVGNVSKPKILCALPTAFFGKHYFFKGVDAYRAAKIRVKTNTPLWVHTDGEVKTKSDCICMTQYSGKLRLIC